MSDRSNTLDRRFARRASESKSRQSARRCRRRSHRFESLERRQVMAAQFIINEFMAANGTGIVDGFGERSDWIEIRNIGDAAGDLAGYHLTDTNDDLDKWTFPANTTVAAGGISRGVCFGPQHDRCARPTAHEFLARHRRRVPGA